MSKALGYDIKSIFGENARMEREAIHFSENETNYYYSRIRELALKEGIRFSTCYIGNDSTGESFEKYQSLWSNKNDCCDALGNVPGFKATCSDLNKNKSGFEGKPILS